MTKHLRNYFSIQWSKEKTFYSKKGCSRTSEAWRVFVIGTVINGIVLGFSMLVFAETPSQELPKPFHKTTPPLFQEWNFDKASTTQSLPEGFSLEISGASAEGEWKVTEDASAPSRPHLVGQRLSCEDSFCYQLLLAEDVAVEYVDLSVRMKMLLGTPTGKGGLAFGVQDSRNFHAVVVEPKTNVVIAYLVEDGQPTELARESLISEKGDWHFLRIQRNTIISKEITEIFFDHHLLLSLSDQSVKKGKLGLVAMGDGAFSFDNLRAMELLTSRPLSRPSAY